MSESNREPGLFVIWEAGRSAQDRILDDLAQHFHINRVTEIRWKPAMVWTNYQRFYADTGIRGSAHTRNKGKGPFLAISLVVEAPVYERRLTSNRGWRQVVTQMHDAKTRYREWTGSWGIHCTENLMEARRDAYMLFGPEAFIWDDGEPRAWDGQIDVLHRDTLGAHGWQSFNELFTALNRSVPYSLIYYGPTEESMDAIEAGHRFDILTSDYSAAHAVLHGGPRIPSPLEQGGGIEIRVAGKPVKLNLRFPGDGLFEERWGNQLIAESVLDARGFYRPKENERYWLMAHYAIAQRAPVEHKNMLGLTLTAAEQRMVTSSDLPADEAGLMASLKSQLAERGIWQEKQSSRLGAAIGIAAAALRRRYQIFAAHFRTLYFEIRDSLLAYLPFLSALKRSIKTLASGNQQPQ